MTIHTTPRVSGRDVAKEHYGLFYAGQYRGERNVWLALARGCEDWLQREQRVQFARYAHAQMLRCLREAKRVGV